MSPRSNFQSDLEKERKLFILLDFYYQKYLKHYEVERVHNIEHQMKGIDLTLTHKNTGNTYYVDEKAQLDYVNYDLPTFAFELYYEKNGQPKKGWLFDKAKKTDFYALVTAIYSDEPNRYTSCKITWINRRKLIALLMDRNLSENILKKYRKEGRNEQGKFELGQLNHRTEGYLYFSTRNKAEKPVNLILRLEFLVGNGIAKRLI